MGQKEQFQWDLKTIVRSGDIETLRELVVKGVNRIFKDGDAYSIIMDAGENMEIIKLLVERLGLPLEDSDNFGQTVLMNLVSQYGKLKVIEYLVSAGANIHARNFLGENALHVATRSWSLEEFKFLQKSDIPVESQDIYGRTVFHHAAASKNSTIMKYLLEGAWVPIDCKDRYGQTPLMLCSSYPNHCFELLVDAGADIAAVDVIGRTALHRSLGSKDNFECLLERCPSFGDGFDKKGRSAIIQAISFFRYSSELPGILKLLLEGGANPEAFDKDGKTALDMTLEEDLPLATVALLDAGASLSCYTKEVLNQILHIAAKYHYEAVQRLLAQGADVNGRYRPTHKQSTVNGHTARCLGRIESNCNAESSILMTELSGHSPIFEAVCSAKITKLLLDAGANVNLKDDNDCTPLHQAVYSCTRCYIDCGHYKVLEMLLSAGADPNASDKCGVTPLHSASNMRLSPMAAQSIATLIKRYISENTKLNARDHDGRTPLHYAAARGHHKIVKVLIEAGADLNAVDADGKTPILMKCRSYDEVAMLLIDAGADLTVKDKNGKSVLHMAIENCSHRVINLLLRDHAYLLDSGNVDKNKHTVLHSAFEFLDTYVIDLILQKNKALVECAKTGSSFLHCAIRAKHNNFGSSVRYILKNNLAPVDQLDEEGQTALQLGLHREFLDLDILLNAGANPRVKDSQGREPLHITASQGNVQTSEALIAAGADVTAKDDTGRIPLHWAAEAGNVELMKLLLQKSQQETSGWIDVQDNDGCTPLFLAVRNEYAVKLLLAEGANVSIKNHSGRTPLQAAIICQNYQAVKLLLEAGSDLRELGQDCQCKAVHLAVKAGDFQMLEDMTSLGTNLKDCWWDPEHKTTLLHVAAENSFRMVKHLIGLQNNPNEWNNEGKTALHCAVLSGHALNVKYLLDECHIPVDQRGKSGKTALMLIATLEGWDQWAPRMMELLIHKGANVKAHDNENRTAFKLALQSRNYDAAEILELEEWVHDPS